MSILKHDFTNEIIKILDKNTNERGEEILKKSDLIQYINIKTKAANRGSKSRASFANHYAIYVLIEDYLSGDHAEKQTYVHYEGAKFSDLLLRQRELPFGSKLQNHALNHRLNEEFRKYFPACEYTPIIRDAQSNRYWINEQLIIIENINLAKSIIEIIDAYIKARQSAFSDFMIYCQSIIEIQEDSPEKAIDFIKSLFKVNVDAGKYFLDIDKVQRYPITFVIKTNEDIDKIIEKIKIQAENKYQVKAIVTRYIESIEEIINITKIMNIFEQVLIAGKGQKVIEEIILQSRIEFNVEAEENDLLHLNTSNSLSTL